jgi:hypothetical protein
MFPDSACCPARRPAMMQARHTGGVVPGDDGSRQRVKRFPARGFASDWGTWHAVQT